MRRVLFPPVVVIGLSFLGAPATPAQEPEPPLQDLVGVRGRDGETQLNQRGYEFVRVDLGDPGSYTFWREPVSNRCVAVRTADGLYKWFFYAPEDSCQAAAPLPAPAPESEDQFTTVCGVEIGGKTFRYRCTARVEGCKGEGPCRTVVTMPYNEYTLASKPNDEVEVTFKGVAARMATSSFQDGQTRFSFDDKLFFVYRSPDRAKRELATLGQ